MAQRPSTVERLAPLTGLLFAVIFVVVIFVSTNSPDADARTAKVIHFWMKHKDNEMATSGVVALGFVFFVWFAGCLRARLAVLEGGGRRLANTCFGGALMMALGGLIFAALSWSAADTVGKVPSGVTQSIHVLSSDMFFPLAAGGALFTFAAGVLSLRTGALPVWLGWAAVVLGVASITPIGFFAFLVAVVWIAIVSVVLYRRPLDGTPGPGAAPDAT
jgi:hypothetical protein